MRHLYQWAPEMTIGGRVAPARGGRRAIRAWIIDDTGFPPGMARRYCGQLGKQNNYPVAVSLPAANDHASTAETYPVTAWQTPSRDCSASREPAQSARLLS